MRTPRLIAAGVTLALAACSPEPTRVRTGQVLLYFDTDAPVPTAPGDPAGLLLPLFDRLRVEIFRPGETTACDGCTNEFEVNSTMFTRKQASIGIAPPIGQGGFRARVRLFKQAFTSPSGEPNADSTVDVTVALPTVDANALVERTVMLATDDVGHPVGTLEQPVDPAAGAPADSHVGTWAGATRTTCSGATPAGSVCVPGGAYWMGNPNAPGFVPQHYVPVPRLVVLSPFFVSSTEVTVQAFRASGLSPKESWSGQTLGITSVDYCTFTAAAGPRDKMPINCVTRDDARAYCKSLGADLPTEAQFEYVAGALAGDPFPWGHDEPTCADAAFGRSGWGILSSTSGPCRPSDPPGGPSLPGSGKRDRLDLPGGAIFDLAGNMTEWVSDTWNRLDEPCWVRPGVYRDPVCTTPSPNDGVLAVHRGGDWVESPVAMIAFIRFALPVDDDTVQTGVRCAWKSR